ncbi:MAG: helix-turn-helix domain-containing protein [Nanoarchaeota archaeon]
MDALDLEKLGLNRNEAKVYLGLIQKGQASASQLVKALGVHRNIVYDNLEKLIDKGLVSFIVQGTKRVFIAEEPDAIIEYLNGKKEGIDQEIKDAQALLPQIGKFLKASPQQDHDVVVFRGMKGIKKVLAEVLGAKENWVLGMSNASVEVMSNTYWKNYNAKVDDLNIKEYFLLNADFKDEYSFAKKRNIHVRRLPRELTQVTEIILFNDNVAMFIYSEDPVVILIKNNYLFQTFRQQFDFLWSICDEKGKPTKKKPAKE